MQDRLGEKFEAKRSLLGLTKDSEVGVLGMRGNFTKGSGSRRAEKRPSMSVGDSVKFHKEYFWRRKTSVNLHAVLLWIS